MNRFLRMFLLLVGCLWISKARADFVLSIATGPFSGRTEISVFDTFTGDLLNSFGSVPKRSGLAVDGRRLFTVSESVPGVGATIVEFDLKSGELIGSFGSVSGESSLALGPQGTLFAISTSSEIIGFDTVTGTSTGSFGLVSSNRGLAVDSGGTVFAIASSSDGTGNVVAAYDSSTGDLLREFGTVRGSGGLAIDDNGKLFAVSTRLPGTIATVDAYNSLTGEWLDEIGGVSPSTGLAYANDELFAIGVIGFSLDPVRVYDADTGRFLRTAGHANFDSSLFVVEDPTPGDFDYDGDVRRRGLLRMATWPVARSAQRGRPGRLASEFR